ncbi:MAG: ABC transporter substrate-binding protein [Flavobacteriales bacterium]|nr:ABC transporter substrate-binding protein [Flavobacteriales bacterium]
MTRKVGFILLLVIVLGCGQQQKSDEVKTDMSKGGGILVLNQFQGFSTLFPPSAYEGSATQLGSHVYETLLAYDPGSKALIPSLAESWEMNDDATLFSLKIREGVFFHDDPCFEDGKGRLMTGKDVLYCLKALCENNPRNRNSWLFLDLIKGANEFYSQKKSSLADPLEGIRLTDKYQIEIELVKPNVEFLNVLAHYGTSIYPKESVDHYERSIGENPVGTGPFKPKVLRVNEVCIMERNNQYWGRDENGNKLPYLNGLKFGFKNDAYSLMNAMSKGLLHIVINADMEEQGDKLVEFASRETSNYTISKENDLETVYLSFLNDEGIFSDVRIRKAFGLVLDKEKMTTEILKESGGPGEYGFIPPAFKNYPYIEVRGFKMNLDSARTLLAEAGYPGGQDFPVITLQIQNRYKDVVVAQEIQQQLLNELGISLSITALPREQHFQRIEEKKTLLWIDNWIGDYLDPQNFLSLLLSGNTPEEGGSYLNTYRYINPTFDSIVDEAIKTADLKQRMHLYCQADVLLMRDAPVVPIYYEKNQIVMHKSVQGLESMTLGQLDLRKVYLQ